MTTEIVLSFGAGLTVFAFVAALAQARTASRSLVQSRLEAMTAHSPYERPVEVMRRPALSGIPFIEAFLRARPHSEAMQLRLKQAGLPFRVGEYMGIRVFSSLLGAVLSFVAGTMLLDDPLHLLLAPVGAIVGFALPALYVRRAIRLRNAAIEAQLVEFCDIMASMLESGFGYMQALTTTGAQIGGPLGGELDRILDAVSIGGDVDAALEALSASTGSRDFDIVVTAIEIQRRSGGNLAEVLRGMAELIRDRHALRREVAALTARERLTAKFLVAFPLVMALALTFLLPETYGRLFTEAAGRLIFAGAVTLDAVGYFVIRRAMRLEV